MTVPYPSRRTPEGQAISTERRTRRIAHLTRGRKITARYADECEQCGQPVPVGANAIWARGAGMAHVECIEALLAEHGELRYGQRTDEQADRDYRLWRSGATGSYADHIAGRADDHLTREERGH